MEDYDKAIVEVAEAWAAKREAQWPGCFHCGRPAIQRIDDYLGDPFFRCAEHRVTVTDL